VKFLTILAAATTDENLTMIQSFMEYLSDPDLWRSILIDVVWVIVYIILGFIVIKIADRVIANFFKFKSKSHLKGNEKRNQTLISVLQNTVNIVIWFIVVVMILQTFEVPVATLLAGAGVVGLAVGFGAQSLVKDMITGFFIILENQFDKGDFVRINTSGTTVAEGEVFFIGLRITKIQGYEGELYIIPNGTINEVVNFSKYNSIAFLDINVSIEEDLDRVEDLLSAFTEDAMNKEDTLTETPQVLGVNDIVNGEAIMRVMLITEPMEHFGAKRRLRKEVKRYLAQNGVNISIPSMDIHDFEDVTKKGDE
jgi:small-conductance mechanosensitive channel